jgi:hypothetical protein
LAEIGYSGPSSSHPGPNAVPTGGNFLFEDSRVEWIKFNGNTNSTLRPQKAGQASTSASR